MKDPRTPSYVPPRILTLGAGDVLAALGPASAGSQKTLTGQPCGFGTLCD